MKQLALAAALVAAPLPAAAAGIGPYSDLIVFGDSYSDGGNAFALTGGTRPNPLFYPDGQFANGDVWATQLGLTASLLGGTNFAVGGAEASADPGDMSPDLADQIDAFRLAVPSLGLGTDPLPAILIGGNDFREAGTPAEAQAEIATVVTAIVNGVGSLLGAGVGIDTVAVFGLFDLGRFPEVVNAPIPELADAATAVSVAYNNTLRTALATNFAADETVFVDTFGIFDSIFDDPSAVGITNTTEGCILVEPIPTNCRGELGYFFQDNLHATEAVHRVLAEGFRATVAPVPAPAALPLLLAALGGIALVGRRRRGHD